MNPASRSHDAIGWVAGGIPSISSISMPRGRVGAAPGAINEDARDGAAGARSLRFSLGKPRQQLPVAPTEIRGQRAVDKDHRRADRAREAARYVRA